MAKLILLTLLKDKQEPPLILNSWGKKSQGTNKLYIHTFILTFLQEPPSQKTERTNPGTAEK